MGCCMVFVCQTCQTVTPLGEGSYTTWLTTARSLEAFDREPVPLQALPKNQRYRACLIAHAGHAWQVVNPDDNWPTTRA